MLNLLQAERSHQKGGNLRLSASTRGIQSRRHNHKVWFNFCKSWHSDWGTCLASLTTSAQPTQNERFFPVGRFR